MPILEALLPLASTAATLYRSATSKKQASKPVATTPMAQVAQQVKRPVQATPIAPVGASPAITNNMQGSANRSIPPAPATQIPFQQPNLQGNPYFQQARMAYDENRRSLQDSYNMLNRMMSQPDQSLTSQRDIDLGRTMQQQQIYNAQQDYRNAISQQEAAAQASARRLQSQRDEYLAERKSALDDAKEAALRDAYDRGVGAIGATGNYQKIDEQYARDLKSFYNNQQNAQLEVEDQKNAAIQEARNRYNQIAAQQQQQYLQNQIAIEKERSVSSQKKQEALLSLREKYLDDQRQISTAYLNSLNQLQNQYNTAQSNDIKIGDLLGYYQGQNTLNRDKFNETAYVNNEKLQMALAKLNKSRTSGSGPVSTVEAQDLVKQAEQLQALDPTLTFSKAMEMVGNQLQKGPKGSFWQQGIQSLLGQQTTAGKIPAQTSLNPLLQAPKTNDVTSLIKSAIAKKFGTSS